MSCFLQWATEFILQGVLQFKRNPLHFINISPCDFPGFQLVLNATMGISYYCYLQKLEGKMSSQTAVYQKQRASLPKQEGL